MVNITGVIYRDPTRDREQFENFLAEISKFEIIGSPVYHIGDYLMYRAMLKCKSALEKSKLDNLIDKYRVRVC